MSGPTRGRWLQRAVGVVAVALLAGVAPLASAQGTASGSARAAPSGAPSASGSPAASAASPAAASVAAPTASLAAAPSVSAPPPAPPPPAPTPAPTPPPDTKPSSSPPSTEATSSKPDAPPPTPSTSASSRPDADKAAKGAEVKAGDAVVFVIRGPLAGKTAEQRAAAASKALRPVLSVSPDQVHVEAQEGVYVVYVGEAPIVQLDENDAKLAGDASAQVHAQAVASLVRDALVSEQKRSALSSTIFSVSLAVFFAFLTLFLVRKVRELAGRADLWLEQNPERVPAIRLRSIEVLHPAAVRSALALAVGIGRWVGQLGLVYAWLIAALSLFEATRGLTERLTGFFLVPLGNFTTRFATSLPIVAILIIAGLALAILLRVVGLFFEGVSQGTTALGWLPADLARPTSILVRIGMLVIALVFVAPVITGDAEGALARAGFVGVIAFGLSATPLLATAIVGAGIVFSRRIRVGEWTEVGNRLGRVTEVTLFETVLEDEEANEVRVPHLALLWHPTRLHGVVPRVVVEIGVEPALATEELQLRLLDAAASVGADPRVDLIKVELAEARFALAATTDEADARTQLLLRGAAEVAAARRAAGRSPA